MQTMRPITEPSSDPQQRALDQVVDDFIAYDVGQLRGAAGMAARQRFAALGPEALPALVRGLNKAAGIHASCPVGVIAGKLISTLQNANDPSLREYAINNIGVGVPEDAPHFHRLKALRKNWLGGPAMPPNVALIVDRLESRQEGELMELMLALSDAPSDTVVAALRSGDEYLGAAAVLAIIQGPQRWDAPAARPATSGRHALSNTGRKRADQIARGRRSTCPVALSGRETESAGIPQQAHEFA